MYPTDQMCGMGFTGAEVLFRAVHIVGVYVSCHTKA